MFDFLFNFPLGNRDLTQLEPAATTAIAACRALLDSWCDFSAELESLGEEIAAWGRIEPPDSVEFALIDAVSVAAGQVRFFFWLRTPFITQIKHFFSLRAISFCRPVP